MVICIAFNLKLLFRRNISDNDPGVNCADELTRRLWVVLFSLEQSWNIQRMSLSH